MRFLLKAWKRWKPILLGQRSTALLVVGSVAAFGATVRGCSADRVTAARVDAAATAAPKLADANLAAEVARLRAEKDVLKRALEELSLRTSCDGTFSMTVDDAGVRVTCAGKAEASASRSVDSSDASRTPEAGPQPAPPGWADPLWDALRGPAASPCRRWALGPAAGVAGSSWVAGAMASWRGGPLDLSAVAGSTVPDPRLLLMGAVRWSW